MQYVFERHLNIRLYARVAVVPYKLKEAVGDG